MIDRDDLIGGGDELGVDGPLDGVAHECRPRFPANCARGLVDRLELRALADLKHERPVRARLRFCAGNLGTVTLRSEKGMSSK